jgi:hypothetical protein
MEIFDFQHLTFYSKTWADFFTTALINGSCHIEKVYSAKLAHILYLLRPAIIPFQNIKGKYLLKLEIPQPLHFAIK